MRLIAAMLLSALPVASMAEEQPVVVELFTSQGCSACPPADALMRDIAGMDEVIVLSLHVDYWDYIGWTDSFGSPAYSARQRAYAHSNHERMVYTPQVIVNGQDRVVGANTVAVMERVHAHKGAETPIALEIRREGDSLVVEAHADGPVPPMGLHLVRYSPSREVEILGGENAGLTVGYSNVVTAWDELGEWSGEASLSVRVPLHGPEPAVVLLQEQGPGRIMAAAEVPQD